MEHQYIPASAALSGDSAPSPSTRGTWSRIWWERLESTSFRNWEVGEEGMGSGWPWVWMSWVYLSVMSRSMLSKDWNKDTIKVGYFFPPPFSHLSLSLSFLRSHGLTFMWWECCSLRLWHKPAELAHCFLFCSCIWFCLYGPFNCILFLKFSRRLPSFSLCSSRLIFALLVFSTISLAESLLQPWYNPLWSTGFKAPAN